MQQILDIYLFHFTLQGWWGEIFLLLFFFSRIPELGFSQSAHIEFKHTYRAVCPKTIAEFCPSKLNVYVAELYCVSSKGGENNQEGARQ